MITKTYIFLIELTIIQEIEMLINSKGSWMKNLWLNSYYILDITLSLMKWEKWSKKPSNLAECWKKLIVPISKSHAAGIRMEEKRKAPWDIGLIFMKTFIWTLIIHLSLLTTPADFTISWRCFFHNVSDLKPTLCSFFIMAYFTWQSLFKLPPAPISSHNLVAHFSWLPLNGIPWS